MKSLFAKFFNSDGKLSDLENRILDAVKNRLSAGSAALWDQQVAAINKVQRLPGGVEVNFYRMARGSPVFDDALAFPNKAEELLVAKVVVAVKGAPPVLKAQIWSVRGFIFSIEYGSDAAYFEEAMAMDPMPDISVECTLMADLTARSPTQLA